ncbi:MAG: hydrogenase nickel incorporation protein HypB [Methanomassiliicoccaceae archaeon]|jgi:hydrogenase nickel incorporation protein HypB|nr:hydrogenase nickel incorporation protein HypB [Methanomassiliicoccaceae archaeon]
MEYDVLKENVKIAHANHHLLGDNRIRSVDIMGSIGSGKTSLIIKMAEKLSAKGIRVGAIAGDVTGDDDFKRMKNAGITVMNCNTGHECHLDANMVRKILKKMDLGSIDVLLIENVGNLVCPADFPLGTDLRMVVISTTEGDDMVRKHPDIFLHSDIAVINKADIAEYVDVDINVVKNDYSRLTGGALRMMECSVKKDKGVDEIIDALKLW